MNLLSTAANFFFKLREPAPEPSREVAILLADSSRSSIQRPPRHRFRRHRHQSGEHTQIYSGEFDPPKH